MAGNFYLYPILNNCVNVDSYVAEWQLPPIINCDPTPRDGLINDCAKVWSAARGTDSDYCVPYEAGELVYFQTQFLDKWNADKEHPAAHYVDVEISFGGAYADATPYLTRMSAWCGFSFQNYRIDTGIFPEGTCSFKLRFKNKKPDGTVLATMCSQTFCCAACSPGCVISIEGIYEDGQTDCSGNTYCKPGTGNYFGTLFTYRNRMRIDAAITSTGASGEKTVYGSSVVKTVVTNSYKFSPRKMLPPFVVNILTKQIFAAPKVRIIDCMNMAQEFTMERYQVENTAKGRMFFFSTSIETKCELNSKC